MAMVSLRASAQPAQVSGKWLMVASGVSVWRSVLPGWPGCPPVFLPDFSRRLEMRTGFFSPSLEGGLAAVGAVQAEPTFQFGDARMQGGQRGGMMRLLRQKQRNEVVLRKLAKGGVFHRLLRIWNLPLCQSEIVPPLHQNRLLAAWPGKLTEPAEPGQLLKFFEAWGFEDPATMAARRKLSALLFS